MNTRVLELIKNPKIITESDLQILQSESEKMPYAQSIRALYLYGINLYKPENYKENLSKTAAYTTDKKILYHFINSEKISKKEITPTPTTELKTDNQTTNNKIIEDVKPAESEIITEIEKTETHSVLNKFDVEKIIETENAENSEFIVVDGEKNRLLYDGEENFLEEKSSEVDLEASKESGQLVLKQETETVDSKIIIDENPAEESISEPEHIEDILALEETKVEEIAKEKESEPEVSSNDISFGDAQEFLPNVKFSVPKNHLDYLNPPKKEKKEEKPIEEKPVIKSEFKDTFVENISEDDIDDSQISFENTQSFEVSEPTKIEVTEVKSENPIQEEKVEEHQINFENTQTFDIVEDKTEVPQTEIKPQISKPKVEIQEPISEWKPMSFSANIPDALIGKSKPEEREIPKIITKVDVAPTPKKVDEVEIQPEIIEEKTQPEENKIVIVEEERPILNVSFFGNDVSKIEEKKETIPASETIETKDTPESNVGTFINTWQSWLKIERNTSTQDVSKAKEKIIDNFIETNPKISQLKEESNYVVKEKKDDISHLMTETLAKLYTEQKLYSKAIKAYEILSEKHPDKKDYFEEKIEEIKEIRKS